MFDKLFQLGFVKTEKENQYICISKKQQFIIDIDVTPPPFATVWVPWGESFAKIATTSNPEKLESIINEYNVQPGKIYKTNAGWNSVYLTIYYGGLLSQPVYLSA